jgi:DNA-binding YbaB/EbfC family protein
MPNINQMIQMAQNMAREVQEKKNALDVEGNAGGGMVQVHMNGHKAITSLQIAPEVVDPDDVEMLQDLIVAAVNDAHAKVDAELENQMGGMGIPGIPGGLPF